MEVAAPSAAPATTFTSAPGAGGRGRGDAVGPPVVPGDTCSLDAVFRVVGGRWKPRLLWQLLPGPCRYGELRRAIRGVSERMLARQLQQLEAHGLVARTVYPTVPPSVEYALTDRARSLAPVLQQLAAWAEQHLGAAPAPPRG
jgi:DNA-binding HxlR family transcriptional regulator